MLVSSLYVCAQPGAAVILAFLSSVAMAVIPRQGRRFPRLTDGPFFTRPWQFRSRRRNDFLHVVAVSVFRSARAGPTAAR